VYAATVRKTFSGARVHTAVDLPNALQIAADRALDLVLLDLTLPACSGLEALERVRRAFPRLPVLVVSASEEPDRAQACVAAGARGYVAKTSALTQLPNAMRAVMAGERYPLTCPPTASPSTSRGT
jgi:two-component system, NarL family, invasion response regulator UvrY